MSLKNRCSKCIKILAKSETAIDERFSYNCLAGLSIRRSSVFMLLSNSFSYSLSPSLSHCISVPLSPSHTLPSLPVFLKPLAKSTQHARFRFRRCCCRCLHLQLSLLCYLLSASLSSPLALRGISSNHLNSFYHVITAAVVYQTHRRILASSSRLPYAPLLPQYPFSTLPPPSSQCSFL